MLPTKQKTCYVLLQPVPDSIMLSSLLRYDRPLLDAHRQISEEIPHGDAGAMFALYLVMRRRRKLPFHDF
jgi:hypothetical protein